MISNQQESYISLEIIISIKIELILKRESDGNITLNGIQVLVETSSFWRGDFYKKRGLD